MESAKVTWAVTLVTWSRGKARALAISEGMLEAFQSLLPYFVEELSR